MTYKTFEDWWGNVEAYSARWERAFNDVTPINKDAFEVWMKGSMASRV